LLDLALQLLVIDEGIEQLHDLTLLLRVELLDFLETPFVLSDCPASEFVASGVCFSEISKLTFETAHRNSRFR